MNSTFLRCGLTAAFLALSASSVLAQATSASAPASAPVSASQTGAAASAGVTESGKIAWYGQKFAGRKTASGEAFNPGAMTMAHKSSHRLDFAVFARQLPECTTAKKLVSIANRPESDIWAFETRHVQGMHALRGRELIHAAQMLFEKRMHVGACGVVNLDTHGRLAHTLSSRSTTRIRASPRGCATCSHPT